MCIKLNILCILVEKLIHNAYNEGYAEGHYDGCFETISDREDL